MINRLVAPTSGRILIDGRDTGGVDPVELRRTIGYVIQQIGLFPNMTVAENIGVVPRLLRLGRRRASRQPRRGAARRCWRSIRPHSSTAIRASCRAARRSASASRARSPPIRRCC